MVARVASLFETLRSEALLLPRDGLTASGFAVACLAAKPAGHGAIRIRYAEAVFRVVPPRGIAQPSAAVKVPEPVAVKE
jgi:hypothetical protein